MTAYQLTIPAENEPGFLARVTAVLAREKINLRAITITSFGKNGFLHLVVDEPERAHKVLAREGVPSALKAVIAVLIEDKPGGLNRLVQLLARERLNIENAYGFVLESHQKAVFVVDVDELDKTQEILQANRFITLDPEALNAVEPFHYMKY